MLQPVDYLSPDVPAKLPWHDVPLVVATDESVADYGCLVENPEDFEIEIYFFQRVGNILVRFKINLGFHVILAEAARHGNDLGNSG